MARRRDSILCLAPFLLSWRRVHWSGEIASSNDGDKCIYGPGYLHSKKLDIANPGVLHIVAVQYKYQVIFVCRSLPFESVQRPKPSRYPQISTV